ncbi:unnamed protein product [Durusdinium trenchii]|uniref:Uncharacterized protein n=1 Tax=Durusdinium trenchii TaxID=1381693 RepID=A0ABP0QTX0_9DINO
MTMVMGDIWIGRFLLSFSSKTKEASHAYPFYKDYKKGAVERVSRTGGTVKIAMDDFLGSAGWNWRSESSCTLSGIRRDQSFKRGDHVVHEVLQELDWEVASPSLHRWFKNRERVGQEAIKQFC